MSALAPTDTQPFVVNKWLVAISVALGALLEIVDRVIWLEDGRIVADRPKAEVLAQLAAQSDRKASKIPKEAA